MLDIQIQNPNIYINYDITCSHGVEITSLVPSINFTLVRLILRQRLLDSSFLELLFYIDNLIFIIRKNK